MKKTLSLALAIIMCITSLSFATNVFAADSSKCATVLLDGIENNSLIDDTANAINECRTASGKTAIQLDNTLCEQAKQRAKDVFVYFDSDDKYLPNGDLVSSYLSNAVISAIYYFSGTPDYNTIKTTIQSYASHPVGQYVNSIGVGLFTLNGITSMYVIYGTNSQSTPYTNFTDANVKAGVNTLTSNITLRVQQEIVYGKNFAPLTTYAYFDKGINPNGITLSNDQVSYISSNSNIAKIKNSVIYPKRNGSYNLTVTLNSNPAVSASESYVISGLSKPKATLSSVKSKKKKQITVSWKNNIKNVSGYEIQYSTSKKFTKKTTKTVTTKGNKAKSKKISKLKRKKTYYVRIRAYQNQSQGEKFYGSYSKTLKVKVK